MLKGWGTWEKLGAPDRLSALRRTRAEKFRGATGLGAFLHPNLLAPLPLPRPPSPSASAHILDSSKTPRASRASTWHPNPGPGDCPRLRRPIAPSGPRPSLSPPSALEPRPHSQEEAHLLSSERRGRWPPPRSGVGVRAEPGRSRRSEACGQPKPAPPQLQARVEPTQSRCKRVSNWTRLVLLPHLPDPKCGTSKISRYKASFGPAFPERVYKPLFAPPALHLSQSGASKVGFLLRKSWWVHGPWPRRMADLGSDCRCSAPLVSLGGEGPLWAQKL